MYVNETCFGFFVDTDNNIYCSLAYLNQVVTKLFNESANTIRIVAGNGTAGSAMNMLSFPQGIFVDLSFNLYVADCGNHRVQLFQAGYLNGTTVAKNQSNATIPLDCPVALAMDGDGYLYICDQGYHRVVRSGSDGLRCVAGCTGLDGLEAYELNSPLGISFDNTGNLFVVDWGNARVQQFLFINDSCGKFAVDIRFLDIAGISRGGHRLRRSRDNSKLHRYSSVVQLIHRLLNF